MHSLPRFVSEVFSAMTDLQICTGLTKIFGHDGYDFKVMFLQVIGCRMPMACCPHGRLPSWNVVSKVVLR